jgi:hypothetical protein
MTSFAFIIGLFPLWTALGAGGKARRLIGTVTITGMVFSSAFAIFLVPVLFVVVERISNRGQAKRPGAKPESQSSQPPAEPPQDRAASGGC